MRGPLGEWLAAACLVLILWAFVTATLQVDCVAEPDKCAAWIPDEVHR